MEYRSWRAFGISVASVGIAFSGVMTFSFILSGFDLVKGIIFLVGVALIIIGIKVAKWDKTEKARLQRIDPSLNYHFYLTFHGVEEEIKGFDKIEQAFEAFHNDLDPWSLRIDPPIGSLAEWKCYYDGKLEFVTEITLISENGAQKWRQICQDPVLYNCKCLKKIVVQKKRPDLLFTGKIN